MSASPRPPKDTGTTIARARYLPLLVAAAFFMEHLDGTVIVTALPTIGASFGTAATDLSLSITAYMVTLAAFIPISAWTADRFGSRTVFVAAVGLFTVASVLCGLSPNLPSLIAARVLQGFAAALMSPVGRLVVLRSTPKEDLVRAIAMLTWPALIAPVIGPLLGGLIATYADWRWIFFLNVPIGLAGVVLGLRLVPEEKSSEPRPFDGLGFVLTAAALAGFIYGLDLLSREDANPPLAAALVAGGLGLGVLAVRHARLKADPLLDLRGMAKPSFALSTVSSGTLVRIAITATPFLLPLMFQLAFGATAAKAGVIVLVYMAGNLLTKTVTTRVLRRFGFRRIIIINGLVIALTLLGCGLITAMTPRPLVYAVLFAAGAARSMQFTALATLQFADITPEHRAGATALSSMAQQVASSLGVAVAAVALSLSLALRGAQDLQAADFRLAFMAMAVLALISALWFVRLERGIGSEVSGHKAR